MSDPFIKAGKKMPKIEIVFDPFHVVASSIRVIIRSVTANSERSLSKTGPYIKAPSTVPASEKQEKTFGARANYYSKKSYWR